MKKFDITGGINGDARLKKAIEKSNKRLTIVCVIWSAFFAIPTLIACEYYQPYYEFFIFSWLIIIIIGVLLSVKICNLIWK